MSESGGFRARGLAKFRPVRKACAWCSGEFVPKRCAAKFCSTKCRMLSWEAANPRIFQGGEAKFPRMEDLEPGGEVDFTRLDDISAAHVDSDECPCGPICGRTPYGNRVRMHQSLVKPS